MLWCSLAHAQFVVTSTTDDGTGAAGTLSAAINAANASTSAATITIEVPTVTLSSFLPALDNTHGVAITINGGSATIQANGNQPFTVNGGAVNFENMTISGGVNQGGAGTSGNGGGGGGLGAGGAIFADSSATVTVQNITFSNNQAIGGAGGTGDGVSANGGNGGGMNVNSSGIYTGQGAVGGAGNGANGGFGGGGAGAGAGGTTGGTGDGGGDGGAPGVGGNGGNGLGGALFINNGSTMTFGGGTTIDGTNTATGGAAGTGSAASGTAGPGLGGGLYVGIGSTALFDTSTTNSTVSGDIYSNGQILLSGGNATIFFTGTNTLQTGLSTEPSVLIQSGTLNGTTNSINGDVGDGNHLVFDQGFAGTYTGVIAGAGDVTVTGGGDITFSGANAYTGGTTIDTATTLTGTTTSLQGAMANSGTVAFDQSTAGTYAGAISGAGNVAISGGGDITFSGANTYGGGTSVASATTLTGTTTSLQGNVTNSGTVVFDQSTTGTYAGAISGAGGVTKNGTGAVTFSGTNTYTGDTNVNQGQLSINGSTTSNAIVASAASIGGTGTINGNLTNSGSITQTGATGTLTVNGNLTDNAGSTTNVRVTGTGHTAGVDNDLTHVSGNVSLNGTVSVKASNNSVGTYTFLNYGGARTGTFTGITTNGAALAATLVYAPSAVEFVLSRDFANVAQTPNQAAVANYLDQNQNSSNPDFQAVLTQLGTLPSSSIASALSQMDGEVYGTMAQLGVQTTEYLYLMLRRTAGVRMLDNPSDSGAEGPVEPEVLADEPDPDKDIVLVSYDEKTGQPLFAQQVQSCRPVWTGTIAGYGLGGFAESDGNAGGGTYGLGGTLGMLERRLDNCHVFGFFGSYANLSLRLNGPVQTDHANDGQFGTYFRRDDGFNYWLAAGSIGFDGYRSSRLINFAAINRTAAANYSGWQATSYLERGVRFPLFHGCVLEPFDAMQYIYLRQNAFNESGAGALDLNVNGINTGALRNLMGARLVNPYRFGWWRQRTGCRINSEVRAIWLHEYLHPETALNARFAGVGGASFATQGLNYGRDWAVLGGGLNWELTPLSSLALNYDMQLNTQQTFQAGSLSFRLAF
jgi:uncharacterized protein with beta-barrel porin domain